MTLDRNKLRLAAQMGGLHLLNTATRLGYRRGVFRNGLEVIATPDGADWIQLPTGAMRMHPFFEAAWTVFPEVDMGR